MEEDNRILIILGRLFLATGQPLINVFLKKEMWLKVNEKKVIFNIFNAVKNPYTNKSCFSIQTIDFVVIKRFNKQKESLEVCLVNYN
jgi:hypothetical protein